MPSDCVLFYSYGDKIKQDFFIHQIEDETERQNAQEKLTQIIAFCKLQTCRRKYLLRYFGQNWEDENCGGCDVCLATKETFDATIIAQKVLSAVIRTGERFGMGHVNQVLRGANTRRIRELRHDKLSVYGIVDDFSDDELKEITELLIDKGLLFQKGREYPTLGMTEAGRYFLRNREQLTLTRRKREEETAAPNRPCTQCKQREGEIKFIRIRPHGRIVTYICQTCAERNIPSQQHDRKRKEKRKEKREGQAYSVNEIRKKYPRAYEKWSSYDDNQLIKMYSKGLKPSKLAEHFGRQPSAIRARLKKLGLFGTDL